MGQWNTAGAVCWAPCAGGEAGWEAAGCPSSPDSMHCRRMLLLWGEHPWAARVRCGQVLPAFPTLPGPCSLVLGRAGLRIPSREGHSARFAFTVLPAWPSVQHANLGALLPKPRLCLHYLGLQHSCTTQVLGVGSGGEAVVAGRSWPFKHWVQRG